MRMKTHEMCEIEEQVRKKIDISFKLVIRTYGRNKDLDGLLLPDTKEKYIQTKLDDFLTIGWDLK